MEKSNGSKKSSPRDIQLFKKHGHINYGEDCSVLSHSFQAGSLAKSKGYDEELILAAYLHDIGHLYPLEKNQTDFDRMGEYGIEAHDFWGAKFLEEKGFSNRIISTVKNHVDSKRYLCAVNQSYYDQLSEASKQTLQYQGGPMSTLEAQQFELDDFFEDSILIRRLDDEAKGIDFEIDESQWSYFIELLEKHT